MVARDLVNIFLVRETVGIDGLADPEGSLRPPKKRGDGLSEGEGRADATPVAGYLFLLPV